MARFTASSSERLGRVGAGVTRVYLDYASFSPVDPRVVALMRPFLEGGVGNPGAPHSLGLEARASLDGARAKVARLVGAPPPGVLFTASATEANNLAIRGLAARARGRHLGTPAIQPISVPHACPHLAQRGRGGAYPPVGGGGGGCGGGREPGPAVGGGGGPADRGRAGGAAESRRLGGRRAGFLEGVRGGGPRARLTGARGAARLPHHASIVVEGVKADGVLL